MNAWHVERDDARACLGLALAWAATVALLGIDGEFAVADDWAYAHTVRVLIDEGRFERLAWTWVPLRTNAAIGWLAARLFGFSFESLRLSSAFAGGIGVLGAFALCRQLGASTGWSALAAVLYGWNPVHLPLSLTFMTDVVFGALVNVSLVALARGLPSNRASWIAAGALLAAAATLSRQPGLGLFLCALLVVLLTRPTLIGWLGFGGLAAALFFVGLAPERVRGTLALNWYLRSVVGEPREAFGALVRNAPTITFTLGAIVLPISIAHLPRASKAAIGAAVVGGVALVALIAKLGLGVPPGIDWWFNFGVGPGSHLEPGAFPALPGFASWPLAAMAGASACMAAFAVAAGITRARRDSDRTAVWLAALFGVIYLGVLVIRSPLFDRYLIAVLAPLLALMTRALDRSAGSRLTVAALAALPLTLFAIGATHDWREREKARAVLLHELLAEGVSPQRIDGGTPFNATHNYGPVRYPPKRGRPFMIDDEYRVGFAREIPGYTVLRERQYSSWMPPRTGAAARVHQRMAPPAP